MHIDVAFKGSLSLPPNRRRGEFVKSTHKFAAGKAFVIAVLKRRLTSSLVASPKNGSLMNTYFFSAVKVTGFLARSPIFLRMNLSGYPFSISVCCSYWSSASTVSGEQICRILAANPWTRFRFILRGTKLWKLVYCPVQVFFRKTLRRIDPSSCLRRRTSRNAISSSTSVSAENLSDG